MTTRVSFLAGVLLALLLVAGQAGYRLNLTPSMPLGLWRLVVTSAYPRGATVAACPPVDAPFLPRGSCPLGMEPFVKQLVGVPGDVVTVTPHGVSVNGGPLLPHSAPLAQTSDGQPLPQRLGTWRLAGYWLYGADSPRSFDSRYFGDVEAAALQGRMKPVVIFSYGKKKGGDMSNILVMASEQQRRQTEKLRRELGPVVIHALHDPRVVEVMLNPDGTLWVDILGEGLRDTGETLSPAQAENLLGTVAALLGTVITAERPLLEGELPLDGSRFQGVLPPVVAQPVFAIRKRAVHVFTLDDYVKDGLLTETLANAIREAVAQRRNLLIVGGTSSGKTTLANAILAVIAAQAQDRERLVILEDTVELQCTAVNHVALRTTETIDLTRLLRATLRLRPDRIIVGEVRGPEALALLKAWNTGHSGGLATVHANSAAAGLLRLEQLIQEAGVPPQPSLIAEAVNVVIAVVKDGGRRFVKDVQDVKGYSPQAGYQLMPLP